MRKPILLVLLFFVLIFPQFSRVSVAEQKISLSDQKVIYDLPHPGILPDNPLFFLKIIRDNIQEFLTRDLLKKADLYLLLSDKYIVMADRLAQKGKDQQAVSTAEQAERYALNILPVISSSKKQGTPATDDFIRKIQNSNIKHREVIEGLMKMLPQGSIDPLTNILELNKQIKAGIDKLK